MSRNPSYKFAVSNLLRVALLSAFCIQLATPLNRRVRLLLCVLTDFTGNNGLIPHITCPKLEKKKFLYVSQTLNSLRFQISLVHVVPPLILFLAKHPLVSNYDLTSLKTVICAAAPLSQNLTNEFLERHPNVEHFVQGES